MKQFRTANDAFKYYNKVIRDASQYIEKNGTKRLTNVGFTIAEPTKNMITDEGRNWSLRYAQREFDWYLSGNRSVSELKKYARIWDKMHNGDDLVNSNYGHLWNEEDQLERVIVQLEEEGEGCRQAWITLFDGKNKKQYDFDTPCTLSVGFEVEDDQVNMRVLMRSNDLWYGFCNDQYCFSMLLRMVAERLDLEVGWYYHYAADLHLYADKL